MNDPEWFYSSLAQSAASIVGVVGAFFSVRLNDHFKTMERRREIFESSFRSRQRGFVDRAREFVDKRILSRQQMGPGDEDLLKKASDSLQSLTGRVSPKKMAAVERELGSLGGQANGAWTKGILRQSAELLRLLREEVESFQAAVLPWSFFIVIGVLAWLSAVSVIWPLAILPAHATLGLSKGLLIPLFAIGILGLLVFLGYELRRLHNLAQLEWRVRQ